MCGFASVPGFFKKAGISKRSAPHPHKSLLKGDLNIIYSCFTATSFRPLIENMSCSHYMFMTRLSFREPEGMVVVLTVGKATVETVMVETKMSFFIVTSGHLQPCLWQLKIGYLGPIHDSFLILTERSLCPNLT